MSRLCEALRVSPPHRGRGVDSGGERRRRPLLTQFTTPKQCPDQQRQILARRHHARFLQRGLSSKRQQRQAVECGNGRAAQEARGPQVTAFCQAFRLCPPHRGRGVEKLTKNWTFETMAAVGSTASSSTQRTHRRSSVGRGTVQSRCGTCQTANASRLSPDIGEPPLRSVACAPRSPGERRRAP